jgi:hypothetical protein
MCRQQVKVLQHDNKIVVAHDLVRPKTEEKKIHFEDLPADMVRVEVTEVVLIFFDLNIHGPPILEYVIVGQCKGKLIKWPKKNIELYTTSTQSFQRPATRVTPARPSSSCGSCPCQTFENAGDNGAGANMVMDKEQLAGETPPHQYKPSIKDQAVYFSATPKGMQTSMKWAYTGTQV